MARNFRSLFRWLLPSWLTEDEGGLHAFALATMKDIYLERVYQGLIARFPRYAQDDTLLMLEEERGITRGRNEETDHYRERLKSWRQKHRVRGSAFAALEQVSEYLGGVACRTIDAKGTEHTRTADGTESYAYDQPWDWDATIGVPPTKARFWIEILDTLGDAGITENDYEFSDESWWTNPTGETIGLQGFTPYDAQKLRDLFNGRVPWKPAGTRAEWLIMNVGATGYTVDETWVDWSYVATADSIRVRSRSGQLRFIDLYPNRRYAGYVGRPFVEVPMLDADSYPLGRYAGTAASANWGPLTLPDGSTYAGNPANFPVSVRLPDDGDFPT